MKNKLLLLIVGLTLSFGVSAQGGDAYFSQFQRTPLKLNPANAGTFNGSLRMAANYRRQWETIGTAFQTINASMDVPIAHNLLESDMFGIGVNIMQDKAGKSELSNFTADVAVSYTKVLNSRQNHFLSLGLNFGYGQKTLATTNLRWGNQWTNTGFDRDRESGEVIFDESVTYLDLGAGIKYFYSDDDERFKLYASFANFHLNMPKVSFLGRDEKIHQRQIGELGASIKLPGSMIYLNPAGMVAFQGPHTLIQVGTDFEYRMNESTMMTGFLSEMSVALGLYTRNGNAALPTVTLQKGGFSLKLGYDIDLGNITRVNGGMAGPEFSLVWKTGYKNGMRGKSINDKFF